MRIIIIGAGQVGGTLAHGLAFENHDVVLVDKNGSRLQALQAKLDIGVVEGHGSYPDVLREAGADNADMIVGVTDSDEVNMIACQVAYSLFNIPKKIARVRSPHYFIRRELFGKENLPVDVFISPENLVVSYIKDLIDCPGALEVLRFAGGKVKVIDVCPYYGGPIVGHSLSGIRSYLQRKNVDAKISAIYRGQQSFPLHGETVVEMGDEVFFVAAGDDIPVIMKAIHRWEQPCKRIMIVGGGNIGSRLAQTLELDHKVKLVDSSPEVCKRLTERLHKTTVLLGEAADVELLKSENIEQIDMFCALTDDEEANIMSSMLAKRLGARQVMALVKRAAYVDLIDASEIDFALSPQQITSGAILKHIRKGDVVNVHSLRRGTAEAIEIIVHGDKDTSLIVDRKLSEIRLPKGSTIGAIVREDNVIIPQGDTVIQANDHLVIFVADKRYISDLEKIFQVGVTYV